MFEKNDQGYESWLNHQNFHGRVREKDSCGGTDLLLVISEWSLTALECIQICVCMYVCVCVCMYVCVCVCT